MINKLISKAAVDRFVHKLSLEQGSSQDKSRSVHSVLSFLIWLKTTNKITHEEFVLYSSPLKKYLTKLASNTTQKHFFTRYSTSPAVKYVGFVLGVVSLALLGTGLYMRFFINTRSPLAFSSAPVQAGRTISFQGRLTDTLGNPINAPINMTYNFYTQSTGGSPISGSTRVCTANPDQDGIFSNLIGDDTGPSCNTELPNSVFTENPTVYLGVTVGSELTEMSPRQQIANVGYSINAETLQGMPPGQSASTVPYINKDGNLLIATSNPGIRSTYASSNFTISSAQAVTIQSAGNGDITLSASEGGALRFNTYNGSLLERLTVLNNGNVGLSNTNPSERLDVGGNATVSGNITAGGQIQVGRFAYEPQAAGIGSIYFNTANNTPYYFNGSTWTAFSSGSGGGYWTIANGALYPINATLDTFIGGTSSNSAKFAFYNVNSGTPTASIAGSLANVATYLIGDGNLATTNRQSLVLGNSTLSNTTGHILLNPNGTGFVGIGTTSPSQRLSVNGNIAITNSSGLLADNGAGTHIYSLTRNNTVSTADLAVSAYGGIGFGVGKTTGPETGSGFSVYIASGGNMGIGDTSPDHKLDVAGNIGLDASGYINWGDTDGTSGYGFRDNGGVLEFKNNAGSWSPFTGSSSLYWQRTLGSLAPQYITDDINIGAVATTSALVHLPGTNNQDAWFNLGTGRVGIGTNSPTQKLEVYGGIGRFTGNQAIEVDGNNGSGPRITMGSNTVANSYLSFGAYNSINNLDTKNRDFHIFSTAATNGLYFKNSDGNVGIGTTSPGYALDISRPASGTSQNMLRLDGQANAPDLLFLVSSNGTHNATSITQTAYGSGGSQSLRQEIGNWSGSYSWAFGSTAGSKNVMGLFPTGSGSSGGTSYGALRLYSATDAQVGFTGVNPNGTVAINFDSNPSNVSYINAGNVGIGDTTPSQLFVVGNGDPFQVNSSGHAKAPTLALGTATIAPTDRYLSISSSTAISSNTTPIVNSYTVTGSLDASRQIFGQNNSLYISASDDTYWSRLAASYNYTILNDGYTQDNIIGTYSVSRNNSNSLSSTGQTATTSAAFVGEAYNSATSGVLSTQIGGSFTSYNNSSGTVSNLYGSNSLSYLNHASAASTALVGSRSLAYLNVDGSSATTGYGVYGRTYETTGQTSGGFTTNYGGYFQSEDATTSYGSFSVGLQNNTVTATHTNLFGAYGRCQSNNAAITVTNCYGTYGDVLESAGAITNGYAGYFNSTSALGTAYGVYSNVTGASTTNYGLYTNVSGAGTNYALYTNGSARSFFGGNVGIVASGYLNFNTTNGSSGYGLRDNSGVIEFKNSAGAWAPIGGSASSYWTLSSGALFPINSTLDTLIGGTASNSAKFAFLNVNSGTPVASISGNLANIATYLTGDGTLGTTNRQSLTLGNSSTYNTTGNLLIHPNGTGNVAIGTTTPNNSYKLHVNGDILANALYDTTSPGSYYVNPAGVSTFGTGLIVEGYIGVNTAGPDRKLEVLDTANPQLRLTYADNTTYADFQMTSGGDLVTNVDGVTNQLVLDNGGSVGVGTAAPRNNLEVGNTSSNQSVRIGGIYRGPGSGYTGLEQETTRHQLVFSSWRDVQTDTVGAKIAAINKTAYSSPNWDLVQHTDLAFFTLGTTPGSTDATTEKMRITSSGNVGIGVTAPNSSYKLHVNGDILANALYDTTSPGSWFINPAAGGTSVQIAGDIKMDGKINMTGASVAPIIDSDDGTSTWSTITIKGSNDTTSASLCIEGTGTGANCDGKLNVGTVDPPYTINGKKYATYFASMTGVKEETTGKIAVTQKHPQLNAYAHTIYLDDEPDGSDLWLFNKTASLKKNYQGLTVLTTANTNTRTWYSYDPNDNSLTFFASAPTNISYRLSAPRFDSEKWTNTRPESDFVIGFVLNDTGKLSPTSKTFAENTISNTTDTEYQGDLSRFKQNNSLFTLTGDFVDQFISATRGIFGQIMVGYIQTQNILVESTLVASKTFTNSLTAGTAQIQRITSPVAEIETITSNTTNTNTIQTNSIQPKDNAPVTVRLQNQPGSLSKLVIEGLNNAPVVEFDNVGNATFAGTLVAETVESRNSIVENLGAANATISGTLVADTIQSQTINSLETSIASVSSTLAQSEQKITSDINTIQEQLALLATSQYDLPDAQYYQNLDASYSNLTVTNTANIYKARISDSLVTGSILLESNSILALSNDLLISSLGTIRLFDNAVVITKDGTMTISGTISAQALAIKNSSGETVASIDASGSARFNQIIARKLSIENVATQAAIIGDSGKRDKNNNPIPGIVTNAEAAGNATLLRDTQELIVYNDSVTAQSLIYLTPTTNSTTKPLTVSQKYSCDLADLHCQPYFTVRTEELLHPDYSFNWLIIN